MSRHGYIIGLEAADEPCAVCDITPRIFKATGFEGVIECGKCGLLSNVDLDKPAGQRIPWPAASPAWQALFRQYWRETGNKITAPHIAEGNVELEGRLVKLGEWCDAHPEIVEKANISTAAPYMSVTAVCAAVEKDGETLHAWNLILPSSEVGASVGLPIDADLFAVGTIVVIQTPVNTSAPDRTPKAS